MSGYGKTSRTIPSQPFSKTKVIPIARPSGSGFGLSGTTTTVAVTPSRPGRSTLSTTKRMRSQPNFLDVKAPPSTQQASSSSASRSGAIRAPNNPILITGYERPYLTKKRQLTAPNQSLPTQQSSRNSSSSSRSFSYQRTGQTSYQPFFPQQQSVNSAPRTMRPASKRKTGRPHDELEGKIFKRCRPSVVTVSGTGQRFDDALTEDFCYTLAEYIPQEYGYSAIQKPPSGTETLLLENSTIAHEGSILKDGAHTESMDEGQNLIEKQSNSQVASLTPKRKKSRYLAAKEFAVFEDEFNRNTGTMRKPPPVENVAKSMPKTNQPSPSTSRKRRSNGNAKSQNTNELAHSSLDLSGSQPTNDAIGTTPSKKPLRIAVSPSYVELIKQSLPPDHVLVDENFNVIELEPQQSTKEQKTLSKLAQMRKDKSERAQNRLTTGLVEILPLGDVNSRTLEGGNRIKADAICENVFHNRDNWLNEPSLRLMDFFHMWKDEVKLLCWLARRRLIPNQVKCSRFNCSQQLHLIPDRNNIDGWVWRCDRCCQTRSIRHRTIFKHCDLSLKTATQILYLWCIGHPTELIPFDTDTSPEEAKEWLYCIREVCRETNKELKERLGGIEEEDAEPGYCRVVEIDEALFTCRLKDRNGKDCVRKVWLLGGAERGTDRVFLVRCPQNSRDAFSLIPVVREFIKPGTAIITDDWEGYAPLNDLPEGYQHYVAQRSRGILNPGQEAVHIQKITCLWSHWKRSFESLNGTSVDDFDACLDEYLWRMQHSKAVLQSFCYSVTLLFDI